MAVRGCGTRVAGGVYAATYLGAHGHPLECFLADPPVPISSQQMVDLGIAPIGVHPTEIGGKTRLYDVVGSGNYPNVVDWVEEARNMGISRRLPPNLPWEKIDPGTMLVVLHRRAIIQNWQEYEEVETPWVDGFHDCPAFTSNEHCARRKPEHFLVEENRPLDGPCSRFWWQDIQDDSPIHDTVYRMEGREGRSICRTIGETVYAAHHAPEGITPRYALGIVGVFPIHGIEVIRDPESGLHEKRLEAARRSNLPVTLCEE